MLWQAVMAGQRAVGLPEDDSKEGALHEQPHQAQVPHPPIQQPACCRKVTLSMLSHDMYSFSHTFAFCWYALLKY